MLKNKNLLQKKKNIVLRKSILGIRNHFCGRSDGQKWAWDRYTHAQLVDKVVKSYHKIRSYVFQRFEFAKVEASH